MKGANGSSEIKKSSEMDFSEIIRPGMPSQVKSSDGIMEAQVAARWWFGYLKHLGAKLSVSSANS